MTRVILSMLAACLISLASAAYSQSAREERDVPIRGAAAAKAIPGRYIVVFHPGSVGHDVSAVADAAARMGGKVHYTYTDAIQGFAATLPDAALEGLRHNPNVDFIEVDQVVTLGILYGQYASTWNLDRIDQRYLPLDGFFGYNSAGTGVTAYVIDTGIRRTHREFTGRASVGYDAIGDGRNGIDCNGHGTHVAGTIGGFTYGVAKNVSLVGVRVLNCTGSGTNSGVIAGVDWVTRNRRLPAVANLSLGGGVSSALDTAVNNSIARGVTYAVAAGNSAQDACYSSPARVQNAITVGATASNDYRASYSNYGYCLDLFAPGSSVTSAWYTSDTAINTISGTSMATPNVAGVAALYLQKYPAASPGAVAYALNSMATRGVVVNAGTGSPNRLLFTNY